MKCLDCEYELRRLPECKCPECGRAFDPADAKTFKSDPRGWPIMHPRALRVLLFATCIPPLLHMIVGYAALLAARNSLGRWPHRYGIDDPKYMGWVVSTLLSCWYLLILLILPAMAFWTGSVIGAMALVRREAQADRSTRMRQYLFAALATSVPIWFLFLAHSLFDPARVNVWLLD